MEITCFKIPVCLWAKIRMFFLEKIISFWKGNMKMKLHVGSLLVAEYYPSYCMIYCLRFNRSFIIMSYNIAYHILTACRTIIWIFRFFFIKMKDQKDFVRFLLWLENWSFDFFPFEEFCIKHEKWVDNKTYQSHF